LRNLVKVAKEKSNAVFSYSPYLMEDGIKMNGFFLKNYVDNIYEITNGICYAVSGTSLRTFTEDISILINRVKLWEHATKAAEEQHAYIILRNSELYPEFGKKTPFQEKIKSPDLGFFDFVEKNPAYKAKINAIMQSNICQEIIDSNTANFYDNKSDRDIIYTIDGVCKLMNLVNFYSESPADTKKVKSSYQDIEHLKHAWKADYLISNDEKLRIRGSAIFKIIGSKTKIITLEDFRKKMIKFVANH